MSIVQNKKAFHEYFVEEQFEAGIMLEGWEVKAIRAGKANIAEAYVVFKNGEFFLVGAHISPLLTACNVSTDPTRTRKLLLNKREIDNLHGKVQKAGYTVMPLDLHYSSGKIKLNVGLSKGKKQHDKRAAEKEKDSKREAASAIKNRGRE